MEDAQRSALARGRERTKAVNRYLTYLVNHKPKRGRKRSPETARNQLAETQALLDGDTLDAMQRLAAVQRRIELEQELRDFALEGDRGTIEELEAEFVKYAKDFAEAKGITYAAFRELGVEPAVLKQAGVPRG